jgi:hypothetical protein
MRIDGPIVAHRNCAGINSAVHEFGRSGSAQIIQNVADAWLIRSGDWRRLVVRDAIRIGLAGYRIRNIDGGNWRSRAWEIGAGVYGYRHGQSSLVENVQHVSGHIVPAGRAA